MIRYRVARVSDEDPTETSIPTLPDAFLKAFRALEVGARLDHATLVPEVAVHHPITGWWLVVWAQRADRTSSPSTWAILTRPHTDEDMHVAAEELFRLVYKKAA